MKLKKLIAIIGVASMLSAALVGCGSDTSSEQEENQPEISEEKTPEVEEEKVPEEETGMGKRTMEFANGEMEVPETFENFLVADYTILENFVALGVIPTYGSVAEKPAEMTNYYNDWERAFGDFDLQSIQVANHKSDTYIEEIIAWDPSFIVVAEGNKNLEKLQEIAPTYVFPAMTEAPEGSTIWKEQFRYAGEFLGKEQEVEDKIAEYDKLKEESVAAAADKVKGKTALVLQLNSKGFKIRMPETQASVYEDMGFAVPEGLTQDFASTSVANEDGSFPVEQIVEFNPDYIFIQTQDDEAYRALVGTPVWENIQAVKDGHVYEITQSVWNHLNGYLANTQRIKDLTHFIVEDKQVAYETPIEE